MSNIDALATEIANLRTAIAEIEAKPQTFDEVWPAAEQALGDCERVFRERGPLTRFVAPAVWVMPEESRARHQAAIGASMVANRKALMDSERARVKAATDGGLSRADKARRIEELRRQLLRAAAKHELALRDVEGDGFMVRPVHPELLIYRRADVERLANAR